MYVDLTTKLRGLTVNRPGDDLIKPTLFVQATRYKLPWTLDVTVTFSIGEVAPAIGIQEVP